LQGAHIRAKRVAKGYSTFLAAGHRTGHDAALSSKNVTILVTNQFNQRSHDRRNLWTEMMPETPASAR
jgi:hypothetical protein